MPKAPVVAPTSQRAAHLEERPSGGLLAWQAGCLSLPLSPTNASHHRLAKPCVFVCVCGRTPRDSSTFLACSTAKFLQMILLCYG